MSTPEDSPPAQWSIDQDIRAAQRFLTSVEISREPLLPRLRDPQETEQEAYFDQLVYQPGRFGPPKFFSWRDLVFVYPEEALARLWQYLFSDQHQEDEMDFAREEDKPWWWEPNPLDKLADLEDFLARREGYPDAEEARAFFDSYSNTEEGMDALIRAWYESVYCQEQADVEAAQIAVRDRVGYRRFTSWSKGRRWRIKGGLKVKCLGRRKRRWPKEVELVQWRGHWYQIKDGYHSPFDQIAEELLGQVLPDLYPESRYEVLLHILRHPTGPPWQPRSRWGQG